MLAAPTRRCSSAIRRCSSTTARTALEKIDLGAAWTEMTGLPFVWAFWAGRPTRRRPDVVALLQAAAEHGMAHPTRSPTALLRGDPSAAADRARRYLRENLRFDLTPRALEGLRTYYREAVALGLAPPGVTPTCSSFRRRPIASHERRIEQYDRRRIVTAFRGRDAADAATTALELYTEAPTALLGRLADDVRAPQASGRRRHLHHRPQRQLHERVRRALQVLRVLPAVGSSEGYTLGFDEIFREDRRDDRARRRAAAAAGRPQSRRAARVVRGSVSRQVKQRYPEFRLHALSPPEVIHISRLSQLPVPAVIDRLIAAGLDSIPGGGAEILVDRVRKILNCYNKATADEWLDVMRQAHRAGLRTTATMMYGTVETVEERLEHLFRLRDLQDETRRVHGVHRLELSAAAHRTRRHRSDRRRISADAGASRGSCSTTSTTCRRRGSRRAARSGSSASPTAPTTWAA